MVRELDHNRLKAASCYNGRGERTKLTNSSMPGGKKGAIAIGVLSLAITLVVFVNAAHAISATPNASSSDNPADSDQGATCTGTGDTQQGECDTQAGDQTGQDNLLSGLSG
jgi:hypothetical protein